MHIKKIATLIYSHSQWERFFFYMKKYQDSKFGFTELKDVNTDCVPDDKTTITKLREKYLTDIIIMRKVGSFTIICYRDAKSNIFSKVRNENKKKHFYWKI